MPKLTEYLLKLATDIKELEKYRELMATGPTQINDYLTQQPWPGLTKEQADAVKGNKTHLVVEAVVEELKQESSRPDAPFYGIGITFVTEANHVQHLWAK